MTLNNPNIEETKPAEDPKPPPETAIPSRVDCTIAIKIVPSKIPGAGRGLIAEEDASPGDLLFSIKYPHLNIIDQSAIALQNTCDNCLASKVQDMATVLGAENLKFKACTGCGVYHYCSKECQKEAWSRHHKAECKVLGIIHATGYEYQIDPAETNGETENNDPYEDPDTVFKRSGPMVHQRELRTIIRLLTMRNRGMIGDEEWEEYLRLQTKKEFRYRNESFAASTDKLASIIKGFVRTTLGFDGIVDLICALTTNSLSLYQPILYDQSFSEVYDATAVVGCGACLEPFAALLNHSCIPNALWIWEGSELRIRARDAITAGEEITLSYASPGEYAERQEILMRQWEIPCKCPLCKKGHIGLDEPLNTRIAQIITKNISESDDGLEEELLAMAKVGRQGQKGMLTLRKLHMRMYRSAILLGNESIALKTALNLSYAVEPYQIPPLSADERLTTLYNIVSLLNTPFATSLFPTSVHFFDVVIGFRSIIKKISETFFGYSSFLAITNTQGYREALDLGRTNIKFCDEELEDLGEDILEEGMKGLLEWAGVEVEEMMLREVLRDMS